MNIDRVGVKQNMSMKAEFLSKVMVVLNIILPFHGILVLPCISVCLFICVYFSLCPLPLSLLLLKFVFVLQ